MGMHAEDLPGFEWMTDGPKKQYEYTPNGPRLKTSTAEEWRGYYETKCRELRKENEHMRDNLQCLVAVGKKHGWNGVDNSKILWDFFDAELSEKKKLQESLDQVDDVLVVNWVGPRKDGDYRKALSDLIDFNIQIATDPCVSREAQAKVDELCDLHLEIATLKNKLEKEERRVLGF